MLNVNNSLRGSAAPRSVVPCVPSHCHPTNAPTSTLCNTAFNQAFQHQNICASYPSRNVVSRAQSASSTTTTSGLGLFPSGMQQARVQLPAVALQVEASQILSDPTAADTISQALQGGCNMIVLWDSNANAAAMYDAALRLQDVLRGRASLLLVDRTDIALAIGAQGVILTDQGVPTVVARRMLSGTALVGRLVSEEGAAVTAAADGANLVLVTGPGGTAPRPELLTAARAGQRSGSAIPLLLSVRQRTLSGSGAADVASASALSADVEGVAMSLEALPGLARACYDLPESSAVSDFIAAVLTRLNVKAATGGTSSTTAASTTTATHRSSPSATSPSLPSSSPSSPSSPSSTFPAGSGADISASQAPQASPPSSMRATPSSPPSNSSPSLAPFSITITPTPIPTPGLAPGSSRPLRRLMDPRHEAMLADEKELLDGVLGALEQALPGASELSLLQDALKALDEPFLVAVVGEFNSGKSSVINAMLGRRYLAEGILPTTNEISILKYAQPPSSASSSSSSFSSVSTPQLEQQADGLYVRYLPARLLQDLHIVDTPGTNVILERQQRLTEEYVPRADLVLFVMSADRPFSESEVRFLEYIRQWQKKVVFVVNKADILAGGQEVAAVKAFVAENAARVLALDRPVVIAVSARAALKAKLAAAGAALTPSLDGDKPYSASPSAFSDPTWTPAPSTASTTNGGSSTDPDLLDAVLPSSSDWVASNFAELESQVSNFLVGRGAGGGEGVRLKLQTPLFVADALCGAASRRLNEELAVAVGELEGVRLVGRQLKRFAGEMGKDAAAQRAALQAILSDVLARSERFVDSTVQISNAPRLLSLVAGSKEYPFRTAFEKEVVGGALESLRQAVSEHSTWLEANCTAQREYYKAFVGARASASGLPLPAGAVASGGSNGNGNGAPAPHAPDRTASGTTTSTTSASAALAAVSDFNVRAISTLLDSELQGAMAGTAGTAVGAPLVGLFAMQMIENTLEDVLLAGLSGVVSYVSLLNLPLRRADIKTKISRVASNFLADVTSKMSAEVEAGVEAVVAEVGALVAPLEAAYAEEVAQLEARQEELQEYVTKLQDLQRRAANLE